MIIARNGNSFDRLADYLSDGDPGYVAFKFSDGTYGLHAYSDLSDCEILHYDEKHDEFQAFTAVDFKVRNGKFTYDDDIYSIVEIYEFKDTINQLAFFVSPETTSRLAMKVYEHKEVTLTMSEIKKRFNLPDSVNIVITK